MVEPVTSSKLHLITFGTVRVLVDGHDITAQLPTKAVALMVYLARQQRPRSREHLMELLWPERETKQAQGNLRTALSKLRPLVGWALDIGHADIGITASLDTVIFETLAASETARSEALAIYQGDFMAGFPVGDAWGFEQWVLSEAEKLRTVFIQTAQAHHQYLESAHHIDVALRSARHALTHAPLCEEFHRTLMHLYLITGERAAALRQYQACRTLLWEELAVEPDASTQALFKQISAAPLLPQPTTSPSRAPRNLIPTRMTSFIGRADTCLTISHLLKRHRLLTLCATGGTGKTRLALEIAHQLCEQFSDGIFFIDLTSVQQAADVPSAVAHTLGVHVDALTEALTGEDCLLIFDNFEHVIEGATFVAHLLESLPTLKILVTSREPLKLYGEQLFRLTALTLEESTQLFRERLRAVIPDFRRDKTTDAHIEAICAQLEGLPLAIELAATRARTLSLDEIRQGLTHRLDLLTSDLRNLPRRQRAMFNTIEWSYKLLTEGQAAVFRSLAVFRGGWTRRALANISDHALYLDDLVDKSLVRRTADTQRYGVLETVREYALSLLKASGEAPDLLAAHARWVMDFAEDAAERLKTTEHTAAITDLREEAANIHAALDFLRAQPDLLEVYARILSALGWVWHVRPPYHPVYDHFHHAIDQSDGLTLSLRAALRSAGGHIANNIGHYEVSIAWQMAALDDYTRLGDLNGQTYVRFYLTGINTQTEDSKRILYDLRDYALTHNDDYLLAKVDLNLGWSLYHTNTFTEAEAILREGLAVCEANGFQLILTPFCINLAALYAAIDAPKDALALLERARSLNQSDGNLYLEAVCTLDQCQLCYMLGQTAQAALYLSQAAALVQKVNTPFIRLGYHFWSGVLAAEAQDWVITRQHYDHGLRVLKPEDSNMSPIVIDFLIYLALLMSIRQHVQAAARLVGGMKAFQVEIQYAYAKHQQTWLTRIDQQLAMWDSDERMLYESEGAKLGMLDLVLFARACVPMLT